MHIAKLASSAVNARVSLAAQQTPRRQLDSTNTRRNSYGSRRKIEACLTGGLMFCPDQFYGRINTMKKEEKKQSLNEC